MDIAIISILAAMLLPAVNRTHNSGSKTTDINNLKQIITAVHLYSGDNNDLMPLPNWDNGGALADGKAHRGWLYLPDLSAGGTNRFHVETGALWETLRQPKLAQMRPDDCAFWETDKREPKGFNDGANWPVESVSLRHNQGGIQATIGGPVNYVRFADWCRDAADPNKNRLWCYPNSADDGDPEHPGHHP